MIQRGGPFMPNPRKPTIAGRRLLQVLWRLVRVYWSSPDAKWGALLFALAVTLELGAVYGNFRLADAERGWKIEYQEYEGKLPSRVRLTYQDLELRLAISKWQ